MAVVLAQLRTGLCLINTIASWYGRVTEQVCEKVY